MPSPQPNASAEAPSMLSNIASTSASSSKIPSPSSLPPPPPPPLGSYHIVISTPPPLTFPTVGTVSGVPSPLSSASTPPPPPSREPKSFLQRAFAFVVSGDTQDTLGSPLSPKPVLPLRPDANGVVVIERPPLQPLQKPYFPVLLHFLRKFVSSLPTL